MNASKTLARLKQFAFELVIRSIVVAGGTLCRRLCANVYVTALAARPLDLVILLEESARFYLFEHLLVFFFVVRFGDADRS